MKNLTVFIPITSLSRLFRGINPGFCPSSTLENSEAGAGVIPITWLSKLSIGVISSATFCSALTFGGQFGWFSGQAKNVPPKFPVSSRSSRSSSLGSQNVINSPVDRLKIAIRFSSSLYTLK